MSLIAPTRAQLEDQRDYSTWAMAGILHPALVLHLERDTDKLEISEGGTPRGTAVENLT